MAINPLQAALRGRIRPTGAVQGILVLALAGLLSFGTGEVAPSPTPISGSVATVRTNDRPLHRVRLDDAREDKIKAEDDEILAVIIAIIQCS